MLPQFVFVQCPHGLCTVLANFTLILYVRDMSLGVSQDSAVMFVAETTAVVSFLCQILHISINL